MQAHPIRRQAIRRRAMAQSDRPLWGARRDEAVAWSGANRGTRVATERKAKGGLECPVSHPDQDDTRTTVVQSGWPSQHL